MFYKKLESNKQNIKFQTSYFSPFTKTLKEILALSSSILETEQSFVNDNSHALNAFFGSTSPKNLISAWIFLNKFAKSTCSL